MGCFWRLIEFALHPKPIISVRCPNLIDKFIGLLHLILQHTRKSVCHDTLPVSLLFLWWKWATRCCSLFVFVFVMLTTWGFSRFNGCNKMTVKLRGESFPLQLAKPVSHSQKLLPRYNLQAKITLQFKCIRPNNLKSVYLYLLRKLSWNIYI